MRKVGCCLSLAVAVVLMVASGAVADTTAAPGLLQDPAGLQDMSALQAGAPVNPDSNGDVICPGFLFLAYVPHDLIVPPNTFCTAALSHIGHDVVVEQGAFYYDSQNIVGHDILATEQPLAVEADRTQVGHNVHVNGATFIVDMCGTKIAHDVTIQNTQGYGVHLGDQDEGPYCAGRGGGNAIFHDLLVLNNTGVDISDNNSVAGGGIGHDLIALDNPRQFVESNTVGNNAHCDPAAARDADGTPNAVGNNDNGCDP